MAKDKVKKNNDKEVKKTVKKVDDKKRNLKKKENENNIKTYEKYTCFVIGILIVLLFISVLKNPIFIPALLITFGLELFCIAYYFLDDKEKSNIDNCCYYVYDY